jgi:hypothetical protein
METVRKYKPKEVSNNDIQELIRKVLLMKADKDDLDKLLSFKADL